MGLTYLDVSILFTVMDTTPVSLGDQRYPCCRLYVAKISPSLPSIYAIPRMATCATLRCSQIQETP